MTRQGGAATTYAYYADGSLKTINWSRVAGFFTYTYTLAGQYNDVTFPNGQKRTYSYDDQGRLLQIANTLNSTNLATYAYAYDVDHTTGLSTMLGQRTSLTATVPSQSFTNALTKYYYDGLYQLTKADYPNVTPFNGESHAWTYDAIGNRLTSAVNGTPTTYTYFKNGANPLNGQRLSNDGVNAYTWDANGNNLTRNGAPGNHTFGYDRNDRLASISGAATASYAYDYQGRRASKTTGGTTTSYVYDGLNLVSESGAAISDFVFGPGIDEPLASYSNGNLHYLNADALGTITATNDPAGTVGHNVVFDAWGVTKQETGTRTNPFTYTSREIGEANLLFYRARYYQQSVGRFTQEDPARFEAGERSWYWYSDNRPVQLSDPLGRNPADKWYGLPKAFWDWYPRHGKQAGDPDLSHDEAQDWFQEWEHQGRPGPDGGTGWKKPGRRPPRTPGGGGWFPTGGGCVTPFIFINPCVYYPYLLGCRESGPMA